MKPSAKRSSGILSLAQLLEHRPDSPAALIEPALLPIPRPKRNTARINEKV